MPSNISRGFLGNEYSPACKKIRHRYRPLFRIAKECNNIAHDIFYALENQIRDDDLRGLIIATLFTKAMSHFQGVVIFSKKGMNKESNCILRTLLENCFWIIALEKKDNLHFSYMLSGEKERLKFFKVIKQYRPSCHDVFKDSEELDDVIEKTQNGIDDIIDRFKIENKSIEPYKVAEFADIPDIYMVIYSLLSHDIHSNSLSINNYLVNDEMGKTNIVYGPRDKEIERSLIAAIGILNKSITSITHLFDFDDRIIKKNDSITSKLMDRYNSDRLFDSSDTQS